MVITNINVFITSHNIDFATFTGQGSQHKLIATTFCFGEASWTHGSNMQISCTTNAGTSIVIGLFNAGTGCLVKEGGNKIILEEHDSGVVYSGIIGGDFGVQGIAQSTIWTRLVGQLNGANKNEQRNWSPEGPANWGSGYYGTMANDIGAKNTYSLHYRAMQRSFNRSSGIWDLQGMIGCSGVNTSVKFETQVDAYSGCVPCVYHRSSTSPINWWHKMTIWELVDI